MWDADAQAAFEARHKRARAHNRPQYLRIQAATLHGVGEREHARNLLLRVLESDGDFEAPNATEMLGQVAVMLGELDEAESRYREVLTDGRSLTAPQGHGGPLG